MSLGGNHGLRPRSAGRLLHQPARPDSTYKLKIVRDGQPDVWVNDIAVTTGAVRVDVACRETASLRARRESAILASLRFDARDAFEPESSPLHEARTVVLIAAAGQNGVILGLHEEKGQISPHFLCVHAQSGRISCEGAWKMTAKRAGAHDAPWPGTMERTVSR